MDETLASTAPFTLCRFLSAMDPGVVDRQGAMEMGPACPPGRCPVY